jgi:hypothetical protein
MSTQESPSESLQNNSRRPKSIQRNPRIICSLGFKPDEPPISREALQEHLNRIMASRTEAERPPRGREPDEPLFQELQHAMESRSPGSWSRRWTPESPRRSRNVFCRCRVPLRLICLCPPLTHVHTWFGGPVKCPNSASGACCDCSRSMGSLGMRIGITGGDKWRDVVEIGHA